jgi:thiamine-monophosphate kinase
MGEFELIARFFDRRGAAPAGPGAGAGAGAGVATGMLGIGDDCALLPPLDRLAVSTDMLVEGRHFFAGADPHALGHKSLAVNLSDLAAMGARPVAFTLALALPSADERWLEAFAAGLFALADAHGCELVGGDTTRGPLAICITVFGEVPAEVALRRDRARDGDDLWVSGELGAAAWEVARRMQAGGAGSGEAGDGEAGDGEAGGGSRALSAGAAGAAEAARRRLDMPQPRIALGLALRGIARAAIDLSDGLLGDMGHVLARSSAASGSTLGATIDWPSVPVHAALDGLPPGRRAGLSLAGGDDYELLFTARPEAAARIGRLAADGGITLTRIGRIDRIPGIRVVDGAGRLVEIDARPFDHFR